MALTKTTFAFPRVPLLELSRLLLDDQLVLFPRYGRRRGRSGLTSAQTVQTRDFFVKSLNGVQTEKAGRPAAACAGSRFSPRREARRGACSGRAEIRTGRRGHSLLRCGTQQAAQVFPQIAVVSVSQTGCVFQHSQLAISATCTAGIAQLFQDVADLVLVVPLVGCRPPLHFQLRVFQSCRQLAHVGALVFELGLQFGVLLLHLLGTFAEINHFLEVLAQQRPRLGMRQAHQSRQEAIFRLWQQMKSFSD